MAASKSSTGRIIYIRPRGGKTTLDLAELWRERDLLYFLIKRDFVVRYRQTLLGFGWAIINPIVNVAIFTIIFGGVAQIETPLPAFLFYLMNITIWRYFASTLQGVSNSLVGNAGMLSKVYFPRLLLPLNSCASGLTEYAIGIIMVLICMGYYGMVPAATVIFVPVFFAIALATALGFGLFFAALNVRYRDIAQIVPFVTQIWMYVTVVIPFENIPERWGIWRYVYGLNPMAGVVEGIRWSFAHDAISPPMNPPIILLLLGLPVVCFALVTGFIVFKKIERLFADIV